MAEKKDSLWGRTPNTAKAVVAGATIVGIGGVVVAKVLHERISPRDRLRAVAEKYTDPVALLTSQEPEEQESVNLLREAAAACWLRPESATLGELRALTGRKPSYLRPASPFTAALDVLEDKELIRSDEIAGHIHYTPTEVLKTLLSPEMADQVPALHAQVAVYQHLR